MIALDAADELATLEAVAPRRRWLDPALMIAAAAVAGAAGFLAIDALRPRPDDALLRDLPVVRRIDVYGRAEHGTSVEFLRAVRDRKLLPSTKNADAP